MSLNSSYSSSSIGFSYQCFSSRAVLHILTAFGVTKALLLFPLYTLILYFGHQRWRQQRSFTTTSHSDIFTYHMAAIWLTCALSNVLYVCGSLTDHPEVMSVGAYASSIVFPGEMSFHCLTCVERYLAVVHPITYLGLRKTGGVRIRNISIGCAWLLCFGWIGITALYYPNLPIIPFFCLLIFFLIVITFCCLSVLCVLIRPRPGEVGVEKEQVDQSKQRAFHTITTIMVVLWLWFLGLFACTVVLFSLPSYTNGCVVMISGVWFNLPSSLVLPLLFIHRAGKLMC